MGLGLSLIIFRHFIFDPGLPCYSDLTWPFSSEVFPMHHLWDEFRQTPVMPTHMLGYLFFYQFSAETSIRLLYIFIFTMMGMSMFYAAFKLTALRHPTSRVPLIVAFITTLFFIVNPVTARFWLIWYFIWFYAFVPLLFYVGYDTFRRIQTFNWLSIFKKALIIALILFIMSPSERIPYYFPFIILAFLAAFGRPYLQYLKRSVLLTVTMMVLWTAFCSIWLVPIALGAFDPSDSYAFSRGSLHTLSRDSTWYLIFTTQGFPDAPVSQLYYLPENLVTYWQASLLVTPVFAFGALLLRRSKIIIWLAIFAFIFIFLGKGTHWPLGGIYEWMCFDAPLTSSFPMEFRRPHRWMMPQMFCYTMLIGFTLSYLLGSIRDRVKWSKIKKAIFVIVIIVFVLAPFFPGFTHLSGDMKGTLRQQKIPSRFITLSEWLIDDPEDYKMMYLDGQFWFGSPKPGLPQGARLEASHVPFGYSLMRDNLINVKRFGELISPWNIKYVVHRSNYLRNEHNQKLFANLSSQKDMEMVREIEELYIFENQENRGQISAGTQGVAVMGGMENMLSLIAVDSFDLVGSPVIFLDQTELCSDYLPGADIIVSNQANLDLYLSRLKDEHIVAPYETFDLAPTKWQKTNAAPRQGAVWHSDVTSVKMQNWQSDYGKGLVRSHGSNALDSPFTVNQSGNYDILVRFFKSTHGGALSIYLDGELIRELNTKGQRDELIWQNIGKFNLGKGKHTLRLRQYISGFNAVNIFAVLPQGALERYESQMDDILQGKQIISIWEAESALNCSGTSISRKYGHNASYSGVLVFSNNSSAWREIEVLWDGDYRLAVQLNGSARIKIDGHEFEVSSTELDFAYLAPIFLEKGEHNIEITPDGGPLDLDVIWLYTVEDGDETIDEIVAPAKGNARALEYEKINPTRYITKVNSSQPFLLAFAETYDRLWIAIVNGHEYRSMPLSSVANGFYIEEEGELEITIEFKAQRWLYWGATISGISIIAALVFLVWCWKRKRRRSWLRKPNWSAILNRLRGTGGDERGDS